MGGALPTLVARGRDEKQSRMVFGGEGAAPGVESARAAVKRVQSTWRSDEGETREPGVNEWTWRKREL